MTWVRIDDGTPLHPKLLDVGPEAAWLWIAGLAHANRHVTNGVIAKKHLRALYPWDGWSLQKLCRLAEILVQRGMWIEHGDAWIVHQYAEYQEEAMKDRVEERRAAARERKRRQRQRERERHAVTPRDSHRDSHAGRAGDSPVTRARDERGDSRSDVSQPPVPSRPGPSEKKKRVSPSPRSRDPLVPLATRADVVELHEAWKAACGFPAHRFRGAYDLDATVLADAIDAYGLPDCLLVAQHAPSDGMVSGKTDEHGQKHDTIRYIFGNADAFNRILRAAHEAEGKSRRKRSAREAVEEASRL